MTIERLLRDEDDAAGQTVRQWRLELDGDHLCIRKDWDSDGRLTIRLADANLFIADIKLLIATRTSMHGEMTNGSAK